MIWMNVLDLQTSAQSLSQILLFLYNSLGYLCPRTAGWVTAGISTALYCRAILIAKPQRDFPAMRSVR